MVSGRISSLIQDAESKTKKNEKSSENLNLIRRESPVGSENAENKTSKQNVESSKTSNNVEPTKTTNNVEPTSAPKLPPKPGQSILIFD